MAATVKHLVCETCREPFTHAKVGRPPKHCEAHRWKPRGKRPAKTAASKAREKRRVASKAQAVVAQVRGEDLYLATQIATARQFWPTLEKAAAFVGVPGERVAELCAMAKEVEADPGAQLRRMRAGAALIANTAIYRRDEISARDAAHVAKALAATYKDLSSTERPTYAQVQVVFEPG